MTQQEFVIKKGVLTAYTGYDRTVVIPDGVQVIAPEAFAGNTWVTAVTIPRGVTTIGSNAFYGCTNLVQADLPHGLVTIGDYAFAGCGLTCVTLPDTVTTLGEGTFYECHRLGGLHLPHGLTTIGDHAFAFDDHLTEVTLPSTLTQLGAGAFHACEFLTAVDVPDGITAIGKATFCKCYVLASVRLPATVTTIGESAFAECYSLESIRIPDGVTVIADHTFYYCHHLAEIILPDGITAIGAGAFVGCVMPTFTIPRGVTKLENNVFSGCDKLTAITIPATVTAIDTRAFHSCSALTAVTIPDGVTAIASETFTYCHHLTEITLPDTITTIDDAAFAYCGLTAIHLPEGVTTIGNNAFDGCRALTAIAIPSTLTRVGEGAFADCEKLCRFILPRDGEAFARVWQLMWPVVRDTVLAGAFLCAVLADYYEQAGCAAVRDVLSRCWPVALGHLLHTDGAAEVLYRLISLCPHPHPAKLERCISIAHRHNRMDLTAMLMDWENLVGDNLVLEEFDLSDPPTDSTAKAPLDGLEILALGPLFNLSVPGVRGRSETSAGMESVEDYIAHAGGTLSHSISLNTDYFVCEVPFRFRDEYQFAQTFGIPILSEREFLRMVEGDWVVRDNRLICYLGEDTDVVIPDGITTICDKAFMLSKNLTTVTVPEGVAAIGYHAFCYCDNLTTLTLPRSVCFYGEHSIVDCDNLTTIHLPRGVQVAACPVVEECPNFTHFVLPDEDERFAESWEALWPILWQLHWEGAQWCDSLTHHFDALRRTAVLTRLQQRWKVAVQYAVEHGLPLLVLERLRDILPCPDADRLARFAALAESRGNTDLAAFLSDWSAAPSAAPAERGEGSLHGLEFAWAEALVHFGSYEEYEDYMDWSDLKAFIIAHGGTFAESVGLTTDYVIATDYMMEFHPNDNDPVVAKGRECGVPRMSEKDFVRLATGGDFIIEDGQLLGYSGDDAAITIPAGVHTIARTALYGCHTLTAVTVPSTVTRVGEYAFDCCENLVTVILSDGVTHIEKGIFWGCKSLTTVRFPASLVEVEGELFHNCPNLKHLILPEDPADFDRVWQMLCGTISADDDVLADLLTALKKTHP